MNPLFRQKTSLGHFLTLAVLALVVPSRAGITVLHHWTLGENDGAQPVTVTKDTVGTLDLTLTGVTGQVPSTVPGSATALHLTNTWGVYPFESQSFATNLNTPVDLQGSADWGFECWSWIEALPGAGLDSESTLIHLGDHTPGSEVLEVLSGNYYIHLPGVTLADSHIAAATDIGKWVHFAMVNQEDFTVDNSQVPPVITATGGRSVHLFRNGVEVASTGGSPTGGSGILTIGSQKLSGISGLQHSRGMTGKLDDVRIFTFALGAFDPVTDLLYPNGPASALPFVVTNMTVAGNGDVTLKWNSQAGKTYSVWESTDLTNWLENNDNIASGGAETSTTITPVNLSPARLFLQVRTR